MQLNIFKYRLSGIFRNLLNRKLSNTQKLKPVSFSIRNFWSRKKKKRRMLNCYTFLPLSKILWHANKTQICGILLRELCLASQTPTWEMVWLASTLSKYPAIIKNYGEHWVIHIFKFKGMLSSPETLVIVKNLNT